MQIICPYQRQLQVLGKAKQVVPHSFFDLKTMVHDLHEIVAFAENVSKFCRSVQGFLILTQSQSGLDLATGAASGSNKTFSKLGQKLAVHAWLEVVTRKIRLRGESK